jgi:hypothetical protein
VNLDDVLDKHIPYRLGAVSSLSDALELKRTFENPKDIQIYFDNKLRIVGNSNAYINPVIESGLMHCRALLEFLGLCHTKQGLGSIVKRREKDDVGLEDFQDVNGLLLTKLSPDMATSHYSGPREDAENALISIFRATHKGIAHITLEFEPQELELLEIASRGVESLIISHLYTPMGIKAPKYKITKIESEA